MSRDPTKKSVGVLSRVPAVDPTPVTPASDKDTSRVPGYRYWNGETRESRSVSPGHVGVTEGKLTKEEFVFPPFPLRSECLLCELR